MSKNDEKVILTEKSIYTNLEKKRNNEYKIYKNSSFHN